MKFLLSSLYIWDTDTCVMHWIYEVNLLTNCVGRFFSGEIFKRHELQSFDYYLRLDDDSSFMCEFPYDIFQVMHLNKLKYGWILQYFEYPEIAANTLWNTTKQVHWLIAFLLYLLLVHGTKKHFKSLHQQIDFCNWPISSLPILEQFRGSRSQLF